ncbi:MAG TPA: hypothetical protein VN721_16200 [Flavipsychrobacter sp.]|nr:hypothetical protein [Flavipsychrobacter sp.]
MRTFVLTALALLFAGSMYAQNFEVGVNGGVSTSSIPGGTPDKGDKTTWNYQASARLLYSINENWQVGGDIAGTKWQTTAQWPLTGAFGQKIGSQKVTYSFGSPALTICAQLNRVIPFYSKINLDFIQSQVYFGVSAGGVITVNDGRANYSTLPTEKFQYTSNFNYADGKGYVVGVQVGYSYFFTEHFGLNVEVAPRYASVYTSDGRFGHADDHYHLFYYYGTLGLRFRF